MSDTEDAKSHIDLNDLGFALEDLVDEYSLFLVIKILGQVCWYKAKLIQDNVTLDIGQTKALEYWKKYSEKLKKLHPDEDNGIKFDIEFKDFNGRQN